jgi:cytochrome P450
MQERMSSCAIDGAVLVAVGPAGRTGRGVDPDRLNITREDPPAMLTFGGGIHYCLGTHPARAEPTGPITLPIEFDAGH